MTTVCTAAGRMELTASAEPTKCSTYGEGGPHQHSMRRIGLFHYYSSTYTHSLEFLYIFTILPSLVDGRRALRARPAEIYECRFSFYSTVPCMPLAYETKMAILMGPNLQCRTEHNTAIAVGCQCGSLSHTGGHKIAICANIIT